MEKIGRYTNKSSTKNRRKELRNNQTTAERKLWKYIRAHQLGVKFRRQYNIDYYIVDFYCNELKLIIELDGWVHGEEQQIIKDKSRQSYLENKGYKIIRYTNAQVKYEINVVLQDIINNI